MSCYEEDDHYTDDVDHYQDSNGDSYTNTQGCSTSCINGDPFICLTIAGSTGIYETAVDIVERGEVTFQLIHVEGFSVVFHNAIPRCLMWSLHGRRFT